MRADGGWLRTFRAGVFAGSAVVLAAAAHQLGGGPVTGAGALAGFVAVLLVGRPLAGRARRLPGTAAATGLTQLGLHLLLEAWSVDGSCATTGGHAAHAMHCSAGMTHRTSPAMVLAHTIAALVLALLLTHGDRALWAFVTLLGLRPPPTTGFVVPDAGTRVAPAIRRRGPPGSLRNPLTTHDRRKPCAREYFSSFSWP